MTSDPIRILFSSDHHFGITTMSQEEMALSFSSTIFPLLENTDIFFINGDFFDTLVIFDSHGFNPIYDVIMDLFKVCQHYNIKLRVLQGTWTHDRNQCSKFQVFYKNHHFSFDFKFIPTIDLEEITVRDRSIKVFYTPDNLPYKSSDEIVKVISQKMYELGWDYVDYGCMHGFFDFTYPKMISSDNVVVYKESQFPFVKKMIDVGHVHQHRISGNVFSNGSFDRICHGDEETKGCIKVLDYPDKYTAQFIKNKDAARFDTLTFTADDTTDSIREKISKHLSSIKTKRKIYLRCLIESDEHKEAIRQWMHQNHPKVSCKVSKTKDCRDKHYVVPESVLIKQREKRVAPTPQTLSLFVKNHIPSEFDISLEDIDRHRTLIQ